MASAFSAVSPLNCRSCFANVSVIVVFCEKKSHFQYYNLIKTQGIYSHELNYSKHATLKCSQVNFFVYIYTYIGIQQSNGSIEQKNTLILNNKNAPILLTLFLTDDWLNSLNVISL